MSLQILWSHELLSCDIHVYNLTMSQHLSLARLNNTLTILIRSRSSLARVLPANNRKCRTFQQPLAIDLSKAPI